MLSKITKHKIGADFLIRRPISLNYIQSMNPYQNIEDCVVICDRMSSWKSPPNACGYADRVGSNGAQVLTFKEVILEVFVQVSPFMEGSSDFMSFTTLCDMLLEEMTNHSYAFYNGYLDDCLSKTKEVDILDRVSCGYYIRRYHEQEPKTSRDWDFYGRSDDVYRNRYQKLYTLESKYLRDVPTMHIANRSYHYKIGDFHKPFLHFSKKKPTRYKLKYHNISSQMVR